MKRELVSDLRPRRHYLLENPVIPCLETCYLLQLPLDIILSPRTRPIDIELSIYVVSPAEPPCQT